MDEAAVNSNGMGSIGHWYGMAERRWTFAAFAVLSLAFLWALVFAPALEPARGILRELVTDAVIAAPSGALGADTVN
jgi:hypothetical protein